MIVNSHKTLLYKLLTVLTLFVIYLCLCASTYANTVSAQLEDHIFRLHVIANSDSTEDQALKLKVRDALLEYMNSICIDINNKSEVMQVAQSCLTDFTTIAQDVIYTEGFDYPVEISIEETIFPTKVYGDVSLPAGTYDALNVKIGQAVGQNWWCVMFPPLCFVDISSGIVPNESKAILEDSLDKEEYSLITATNSSSNVSRFKFKIVELVEEMKSHL